MSSLFYIFASDFMTKQLDADLKTILTKQEAQKSMTMILTDTKKQLTGTVQEAKKRIRLCAWISITVIILCAALCALAVLWSR